MKYELDIRMLFGDVDPDGRARPVSIFKYFEESALANSAAAGLDLDFYAENNMVWMLYKYDMKIREFPLYPARLKVLTQPTAFKKFYGYRKYELMNEKGELLIDADTMWLFVDTRKMRPKQVPEIMFERFGIDTETAVPLTVEDAVEFAEADSEKQFEIRYSDLDINGHVNHTRYVEWALESLSSGVLENNKLSRIKAAFKKEVRPGKGITARLKKLNDLHYSHSVQSGGKEACLLETEWT